MAIFHKTLQYHEDTTEKRDISQEDIEFLKRLQLEMNTQDTTGTADPRLEGIREQVYQLILKAEHMYKESGTGQQKLKWVVQQARGLLPKWLQVIMSEDALLKIIDVWFCGVKDLLDDGKINGSQKEGA